MLQIGSVVDRKYKILSEVGHGGMSVVYLAINERANKTWAVKEVRKDGICDFEAVRQGLIVETDMLKRLNHPHLPSIIDVIDTDDSFLIVMDYIEGKSLQSVLKNGGAQSQEQVIEWGKQICDVLGYLHSREPAIIYRDMKPANVMLKPDGNVMLIDFGTAREFKNRAMVEDTTCLGTRGYAAPEQFGGRGQTDARTDIYCLGATLYHLLTGHSPAEPPYEIKQLRYWNANYAGTGIEKIIDKCCQQDPSARYQNCAELMYALEHVQDEDDATRRSRKRKWRAFVAGLCICGVGLLGMLSFGLAKKSAEADSYSYNVKCAAESDTLSEAAPDIRAALKIDPGNKECYEVIWDLVDKDKKMNAEEDGLLKQFLRESNGGTTQNIDFLKENDRAYYDLLNYNLGRAYFFLYDDSEGAISQSKKYFDVAKDSKNLTEVRRSFAERLSTIAGIYEKTHNNGSNIFDEDGDYSYFMLWDNLVNVATGHYPEDSSTQGYQAYNIKLCQRVANLMKEYCPNFKDIGKTREEIQSVLDEISVKLNDMHSSIPATQKTLLDEWDAACSTVEGAQLTLDRVYKD